MTTCLTEYTATTTMNTGGTEELGKRTRTCSRVRKPSAGQIRITCNPSAPRSVRLRKKRYFDYMDVLPHPPYRNFFFFWEENIIRFLVPLPGGRTFTSRDSLRCRSWNGRWTTIPEHYLQRETSERKADGHLWPRTTYNYSSLMFLDINGEKRVHLQPDERNGQARQAGM